MKAFLKKCHVANYCRKIKQLLDKIEEGRKFIELQRSKENFDLNNMHEIKKWESYIKNGGTPVSTFYESWVKIYESQKLKLLTQNDNESTKLNTRKRKTSEDSDLEIPVEEM